MKRMIVSTKSIRSMTYEDVLAELKRCILRKDKKRMQELASSRYYDDAMDALRRSMGVCASEIIASAMLGSRYDLISSSGYWYVLEIENNEIVAGPFDSKMEALDYFELDEDDEYDPYEERDIMTDRSREELQHEKYLDWFDKYAKRLPGRIDISGYTGTRNHDVLVQFVDRFNKSHPEANLEIEAKTDSDGSIYFVV